MAWRGSSVLVEELPDGNLQDIGGRLVTEHGEALEVLASHDPTLHSDRAARMVPVSLASSIRSISRWQTSYKC